MKGSVMRGIVTVNVGSSSVKLAVYGVDASPQLTLLASGMIDHREVTACARLYDAQGVVLAEKLVEWQSIQSVLALVPPLLSQALPALEVVAFGHRVVHGGALYTQPCLIDDTVADALRALVPLAPLHLPQELVGIDMLRDAYPTATHVACFDTAFHAQQDPMVRMYALPRRYTHDGVVRYGFHGLSYAYVARKMADVMGAERAQGRVIVLHLGSGASACAMLSGKSVASSMGFTALDGLVMGSRCGALDAGVVFYLQRHYGLTVDEVEQVLYQQSGLKGVSGISADVRTLEASADPDAALALEMFAYRVAREIGSLAAALGGLDALVFTAGIGEHSASIRKRVTTQLGWLGAQLDEAQNMAHASIISSASSRVGVYVMATNEEQMIAQHTADLCIGQ
jgi:acetate kinase